ncbi:MAG: hypothetical protein BZY79_03630 [SAR202 cluster bacterium Casp-Chloro-G4]|nr:hypothetical protein [Chloroflexota bacterium]MDA1227855.1 hypothetical protein [Chloroflexota bacterium]PKB61463.1 MAG: hypothetical protein BZY79_03630 [SAR202 cluster bacterium Casp-Chloro-G4]
MVPEAVEAIAVYVGLLRDIIMLVLLLALLATVILTYRKVSQAIGSVGRIVKTTEEMVASVQDNIVGPASKGSGVAFGVGKVVAFLRGSKKQE